MSSSITAVGGHAHNPPRLQHMPVLIDSGLLPDSLLPQTFVLEILTDDMTRCPCCDTDACRGMDPNAGCECPDCHNEPGCVCEELDATQHGNPRRIGVARCNLSKWGGVIIYTVPPPDRVSREMLQKGRFWVARWTDPYGLPYLFGSLSDVEGRWLAMHPASPEEAMLAPLEWVPRHLHLPACNCDECSTDGDKICSCSSCYRDRAGEPQDAETLFIEGVLADKYFYYNNVATELPPAGSARPFAANDFP